MRLSLNVTADPVAPFSTFEARLSNGTLSRGEIVVPHPGAEAKAPRAVYTSLPYPGVPSGTERWGIGFSNGLSEATVTEVTVESVSGTSLFADVAKVQDLARSCIDATCGRVEVSSDGTTITWSGSETVLQGETRDLILDVTTTDATTNVTSDERRAYPEVHFPNGYDQKLTRQVGAPGLYTARIPPEEPLEGTLLGDSRPKGYPAPAETSTEAQTYSARVEYWPRGELWKVDSNFTYTVDPDAAADELVLDTQGAVSASQVEVTPSTTTPGGLVWTRVNAANVLSEVAAQDGQDVEMTTRLYTPPTLGHEPAQAVRTDLSSEGVGEPVTDVHVADVTTHDGPEAALAAGDGQVHVYHVAKGTLTQTQLWTRDVAGEPRVLDSGAAGPASPRIYAGADEGTLTALDPSGGTTWTHDTGSGAVDALHPWRYPGASATDGIWALRHPTSGAGADQAGLRWYQVRIDRSTVTPTVTTEATGDAGGDSGAATTLGSRLATAVASSGSGARTWVNATAPDGSTAWSTPLEARFERVADAARLDADGDGAADLAVALATDGRSGQIVLLDGKGGDVIGRSSKESLALLTPVGDVTDAPGDEMAFASSANRVGLLEVEGGSISTPWVREVEPEHDASAPAVSADWDGQIQWNGCGGGPSCFLAHTSESGGTPPQPVGLDVVDRTAAQGGLVLAFTYSRGHEVAGTATGSIAYHDLDTGQEAGSTEVPPPAGTPVAADGDGVSWLAAGTDRGHLVAADPTATYPTNSQASGDRSVFHVPVAVEDGAFYGTYVVDVEIAWSPADISHRQSVHLTSRFSVIPASATQGPNGFVYDTKLNVASPTRP